MPDVDQSRTPIATRPADVAGLQAALAEAHDAAQVPPPVETIPHDGWKSRRAIASSVAAGAIFLTATALLLVSGKWSEVPFFPADYWVKALWVEGGILAVGWGLMTVDKGIEVIKLIKGVNGKKP